MKKVLLGTLVALVGATGVAGAHGVYRAPLYVALSSALNKAHALWGAKPCNGHYRVELVRAVNGSSTEAGEARFNTPTGRGFYTSAPATWSQCELLLRFGDWSQWGIETNWTQLCSVVLHEYGHLTGHVHSDPTPGEVTEASEYKWTYGNAPGVAMDAPEQDAVMRSGVNGYSSDRKRCGMAP